MKFTSKQPPRVYPTGYDGVVRISDCGELHLEPDEQITLITDGGGQYDVTRKNWGFYATPSLNGRLATYGLRGVLVHNRDSRFFVLLVEAGHEASFVRYCAGEKLVVAAWLDTDAALVRFAPGSAAIAGPACPCGAESLEEVFHYTAPPAGEVRFPATSTGYDRTVFRCAACGHYLSRHAMDLSALYDGEYVTATYGDDGLARAFARITSLPLEKSDNEGRARAVATFAAGQSGLEGRQPRLLDIGSGLAVFPWRMARQGWDCTALDPDPRAVAHARQAAGVRAVQANFLHDALTGSYDVITYNKVLEHVFDPVAMLRRALALLVPGGFVYVELPDGEAAVAGGSGREEFFIDHHHVFSMASLAHLVKNAGFSLLRSERLREPSGKYTLRGFLAAR